MSALKGYFSRKPQAEHLNNVQEVALQFNNFNIIIKNYLKNFSVTRIAVE